MFNQPDNIVNEYEIKSTLSSENEKTQNLHSSEEEQYNTLEGFLSCQILGENLHGSQRIFIESQFNGLVENTTLYQIPCYLSADKTTLMVFVNQLDTEKFSKNTLFNLVDSAQKVSSSCHKMVLIMDREVGHYTEMKKLFSIIDANRLTTSKVKQFLDEEKCAQTL